MEFKEKLIYAIAVLNLTQKQLAKKLGVSFSTINRWKIGKVQPSKKAFYSFEIFCQVSKVFFR